MTQTITKATLTKRYGKKAGYYARTILQSEGILGEGTRAEGERFTKFEVKGDLPSREEIDRRLAERYTADLESLVEDAFSTIEEVKDELRDWADNMPENLQQTSKYEEVDEAAQQLETAYDQKPEMPEIDDFRELTGVFIPDPECSSRNDRVAEACGQIDEAISICDSWLDDEANAEHDQRDEVNSFRDELDSAKSEAEAVECPGMF